MSSKKRKVDAPSSFQGTSAKMLRMDLNQTVIEEPITSNVKEAKLKKKFKLKRKSLEPSTSTLSLNADGCSVLEELDEAYKEVFDASQNKMDSDLPDTMNVLRFAECRASEIATIMQEVTRKRPKLSQQQLPHHMRRRAASHNANRIPRRLREKALKEVQKAKKSKRPSRRHRRRPKNLLAEYNRRQRKFVWLETHIWFAKRFKMQELWGYKIPLHPNDKNVRAAYRATAHGVLIQDLSYFCCIELAGTQEVLLSKLSMLTNPEVGMTFAAKISLNGSREGHTFLYQPYSYPTGAIGPVSFIWKPIVNDETNKDIEISRSEIRQLWIWCHPSMHKDIVKILVNLFDLKGNNDCENNKTSSGIADPSRSLDTKLPENVASDDPKDVENKSDQADTILENTTSALDSKSTKSNSFKFISNITRMKTYLRFQRTPTYESDNVKMTLLKDNLVRHRLIGPMAFSVVTDTLSVIDVSDSDVSIQKKKWWEVYYKEVHRKDLHIEKKDLWNELRNCPTAILPPKTVIGLTVKDPRLNLPVVKREMENNEDAEIEQDDASVCSLFTSSIASSALWNQAIRDEVTSTKQAESTINQIREQFLVTEKTLDLGRDESRIPVIAIQQTGINGYSSGWDIIAPLGWSMPFWIAFIYRKAHAAGLREFHSLHKELQQPLTPYHFPDTQSGREFGNTDWQQKMTKHYRYPPNKRPSFQKLGVLSPYCMEWGTLVADWRTIFNKDEKQNEDDPKSTTSGVSDGGQVKASDFFVLRNKKQIRILKEMCNVRKSQKLHHAGSTSCMKSFNEFVTSIEKTLLGLKQSIILVQLKNVGKGILGRYSGVYLLQESDAEVIKRNSSDFQLCEPIHPVVKVKKVKKKSHKSKKVEPIKTKDKKIKSTKDTSKEMQLVKPTIDTIFSNCSRTLIGYVDDGAYSFRNGYGCGIGHCTLMGFLEVVKLCQKFRMKPLVLTRAQNSLQYKVSEIDVCNCL